MTELRCLTIRQPWASLLVDPTLPKWIETRSRRTHVRGTIGIIAGKWRHPDCVLDVGDYESVATYYLSGQFLGMVLEPPNIDLPLGALIGTVDLYDCLPISDEGGYYEDVVKVRTDNGTLWRCYVDRHPADADQITDQWPYGDFTPGRWAWFTRNPVLFDEPVPMAGSQGWKIITT